jgi:hypothetical protein
VKSLYGTSAANGHRAIDMTGWVLFEGAVTVLRQPGRLGGRHWFIRHTACGHEQLVEGWTLRHGEKHRLSAPKCKTCLADGTLVLERKNHVSYQGQRIGPVLVLREAARGRKTRWECRCDCGTVFLATSSALRRANPETYGCPKCRQRNRLARVRAALTGRKYAEKDTRRRRCAVCEGQTWRRPVGGCPGCGEAYEPEKLPTIADFLTMPRESARELL